MKLWKHEQQLERMEQYLGIAEGIYRDMTFWVHTGLFTKAAIELRVSIARHKRAIQRKKRLIKKLEAKVNGTN